LELENSSNSRSPAVIPRQNGFTMLRRLATFVSIIGGYLGTWCTAAPEATSAVYPTTQEMMDEVRALRAEVKGLHEKLNARQATTQADAAASPEVVNRTVRDIQRDLSPGDEVPITAGYFKDRGFLIRSDDERFLLHPWAFVQIRNATNYREKATASSSDTENGFELPRMKFILDGNLFSKDLTYQFIWATNDTSGNLQLQDAWARYHIPGTPFAIRAGQIRDPVDHEQILYATKSLLPDRSIVNNVLLNGDDIVKGASISYGFDTDSVWRTEVAITSGERNFDTSYQQFPTNTANWGASGRVEYKAFGNWGDYTQFTSLSDKTDLLVFGAGFDYTEAGTTGAFTHVVDAQYNMPDGLALYAAYLGRYTRHNGGPPTTNGQFTGAGPDFNTYDATLRLTAAYLIDGQWEPFVRYEYLHFDGRELSKGTNPTVHDFTLGFNYYFHGHRAKVTAGATYLPNGSPVSNTISDLQQSHGGNELIVQVQFQLIL
jgi:hypothetical protein